MLQGSVGTCTLYDVSRLVANLQLLGPTIVVVDNYICHACVY